MLISKSILRNLILEALLLEGISKNELISKYRYLDKYTTYLDKLNPKYYNTLDKLIEEFLEENEASVSHGVIIFMLMMHQKYASTNLLPNEYKDFTRLNLTSLQKAIEDLGAQYTDGAIYGELVELDKKTSQQMIIDDKAESNNTTSSDLNTATEVRPGLFHLKTESGWQILKPETVAGSRAIGVESWCTVYSEAFSTYKNNGIILYYCAKDGKNYKEQGYGFDYESNPYDYLSIGFHNGRIYIPSGDYESSVWGNQKGVTYQNLEKHMGAAVSKSVIIAIKKHFSKYMQQSINTNEDNQKEFLEQKYRQAIASNPRVLKKVARSLGPDQTLETVMQAMNHPMLSDLVLDFIFAKYYKKIDSKMRKTSTFVNKGETGYLEDLRNKFFNIHKEFSKEQASILMRDSLNSLNTSNAPRHGKNDYFFRSSIWGADIGESNFERILDMMKVSEFENYSDEKAHKQHGEGFEEFPFSAFIVMFERKNKYAAASFFKRYNLGTYDTFLFNFINQARSKRNKSNVMSPYSGSYTGTFWSLFIHAARSNLMPQNVKDDLIKLRINNTETMPHDDLHYSRAPYKNFYADISEEEKKKMGIQNISEEYKLIAEKCDRYLSLWNDSHFYRSMVEDQLKNQSSEISTIVLNKMKDFLANHNKLFKAFPNSIKMSSDVYKPIVDIIASFPPEESIEMLESLEGLNDRNDFYFVYNFITKAAEIERGDEYCVEIFDWTHQRAANKKVEQDSSKNELFRRLSRMIYGGYDGMKSKGQVITSYRLYKNNPQIFFKCLEYAFMYLDYNDSRHPVDELSKMIAYLVRDGILTYDQAVKERIEFNQKVGELAKSMHARGKMTEGKMLSLVPHTDKYGIERGYLRPTFLERHNPNDDDEDEDLQDY